MTEEDPVVRATGPAMWLLEMGLDGVPLTQTFALSRAVVREAAERWPDWWNAKLFGVPHREADVPVVGDLREGLLRLKLVRRRGRALLTTPRGRELMGDRAALLRLLISDLGGGYAFAEMAADVIVGELPTGATIESTDLRTQVYRMALRGGWRTADGSPPSEQEVASVVSHVMCLGAAYGVLDREEHIERDPPRYRTTLTLSAGARAVLTPVATSPAGMPVLVFRADLTNAKGVSAQLAVGADQHLTALHDAIQEAFGWWDDHLYSFWLDGRFWGGDEHEYTSPVTPDHAERTAEVPLAELDLAIGQNVAYVFDFGDEWRVRLTLVEQVDGDGGGYPRVLSRRGQAPDQYAEPDE